MCSFVDFHKINRPGSSSSEYPNPLKPLPGSLPVTIPCQGEVVDPHLFLQSRLWRSAQN